MDLHSKLSCEFVNRLLVHCDFLFRSVDAVNVVLKVNRSVNVNFLKEKQILCLKRVPLRCLYNCS